MGLIVSINGTTIAGLLQLTVTSNNYYSSDTFSANFAAGPDPLQDIDWWSQLASGYVEFSSIGGDLPDYPRMITGDIDTLVIDPVHQTVAIEGRDLSARLIDSYVQQDFVNQTASEVVATLSAQFGMDVELSTTAGNVGRFFEDGFTKVSLGQYSRIRSNWDLVVQLAREQQFDVFVQGTTLTFQPTSLTLSDTTVITPQDVMTMRIERNLTIPSSPKVQVQSWNSQKTTAYNSLSSSDASPQGSGSGLSTPGYLFSASNLTSSQVDAYQAQYQNEVARLGVTLQMEMPWNFSMNPRQFVLLINTNSALDGLYQIDHVERRYSSVNGSTQAIRAISWNNQASSPPI